MFRSGKQGKHALPRVEQQNSPQLGGSVAPENDAQVISEVRGISEVSKVGDDSRNPL